MLQAPRSRPARRLDLSLLGAVLVTLVAAACGVEVGDAGGGGSSSDWYYHWSCNGDPECLALGPGQPNQASGTLNEGPVQVNCTQLLTFASKFWNIPPATNSCDHDPSGTNGTPPPAPTFQSITVTPANPSLPLGTTRQMTATGHYSDGSTKDLTTQVTWSKGVLGVITLTSDGLVTAVATGTNTVSALLGSISGSTTVRVTAAVIQSLTVEPAAATVQVGLTQQFTATAHWSDGSATDVTALTPGVTSWRVGNGSSPVATLGLAGLVTGAAPGVTTVTVGYQGKSATADLTVIAATLETIAVSPATASIAKGLTQQFEAIGSYSNGQQVDLTGQVTWASLAAGVATVAADGLATGVGPGTATISASLDAIAGSAELAVTAPVLQSIAIAPRTPVLVAGMTLSLSATGTYSDSSTQDLTGSATWSSATLSAATVTVNGLVTAVDPGTSVVRAASGAISDSITVTVLQPGAQWTPQASGSAFDLTGVAWSGTTFVAVGTSGTILSSADGTTWTSRTSNTVNGFTAVTWSGSMFVAVGVGATVLTSPDGITWTPHDTGVSGDLLTVARLGSLVVAGGTQAKLFISTNGTTWAASSLPAPALDVRALTWDGTSYVAVGFTQFDGAFCKSLDPASTWTCNVTIRYLGVAPLPGSFLGIGQFASILATTDGSGFGFVAAPFQGPTGYAIAASPLGAFAAVADAGGIATSPDGNTWTPRISGTTRSLFALTWAGSRLVVVGAGGTILVSP
jgi:trimeric autotransporter adhesin